MDNLDNQKNNFFSFLNEINKNNKIGIIAHAKCNDGLISSIFLNEILKNKFPEMSDPLLCFKDYTIDLFERVSKEFKAKQINKVFVLDMSINSKVVDSFKIFCKEFDVCYIDHHPSDANIDFVKNIIKTESADCTSLNLYKLGQPFLNKSYFKELLCAVLISEFSYVKLDNLKLLQKFYPKINLENINQSEPFKLSNSIGSIVVYYKDDTPKIYEIVYNNNFSEIERIHKIVSSEINKHIQNFNKINNLSNEKILFYEISSVLSIDSIISTILSTKNPSKIILVYTSSNSNSDSIKVSARCQIEPLPCSMSDLLNAGIYGIHNASAGGHLRASGGSFMKKDLEIFKKQVMSYVKSHIN